MEVERTVERAPDREGGEIGRKEWREVRCVRTTARASLREAIRYIGTPRRLV